MDSAIIISSEVDIEALSWFSLNNYEVLTELTFQEFFNELSFRLALFEDLYDEGSDINIFPNSAEWQSILAGNILVAKTSDDIPKCKCIKNTYGVAAVTNQDLENYADAIALSQEQRKTLGSEEKDPYLPHKCPVCENFTINFHCSEIIMDELLLKVDLRSNTDKEIHAGIDLVISEFRDKMKIPEPSNKVTGVTKAYIKTVIYNNLIPYIDLRLWAIYCSSLGEPLVFEGINNEKSALSFLIEVPSKSVKKVSIISIKKLLFPADFGYEVKSDKYVTSELPDLLDRYLNNDHYRKAKYFMNKTPSNKYMKTNDILAEDS